MHLNVANVIAWHSVAWIRSWELHALLASRQHQNFGGKFPKIERLVSYDAKFHAAVHTTVFVFLLRTAAVMFLSRFGRQKVSYRDCQECLDLQGGVSTGILLENRWARRCRSYVLNILQPGNFFDTIGA